MTDRPTYIYENHGHDDRTDPDCIKCWQRIAHEAQMAGAEVAEGLQEQIRQMGVQRLHILGRASNVVEIAWSVPEQEPGSLLDTLLAAIEALGQSIAPASFDHVCQPPEITPPGCELWRCIDCGRLWQNSITKNRWIVVPPNYETIFERIGLELP